MVRVSFRVRVRVRVSRNPSPNPSPSQERVGEAVSLRQRERGSLGAMGAGQWTGQFRTRPHALLDVRGLASVEQWERCGLG